LLISWLLLIVFIKASDIVLLFFQYGGRAEVQARFLEAGDLAAAAGGFGGGMRRGRRRFGRMVIQMNNILEWFVKKQKHFWQ